MSDQNNSQNDVRDTSPPPLAVVSNHIGRQRGRRVPPLPTYTFASSEVTVGIRRLGPFTMDEIRKKLLKDRKPPKPPVVTVPIGEMAVMMPEEHPDDPTYKREKAEYDVWLQTTVAEHMLNLMINYCIVCDVEPEVVEEKRGMLAMIDPAINDEYSDREIYIRYYLLGTPTELQEVQQFILGQSMPTPEAVQAHIDTFPSDVSGETPVLSPGAPIRLPVQ